MCVSVTLPPPESQSPEYRSKKKIKKYSDPQRSVHHWENDPVKVKFIPSKLLKVSNSKILFYILQPGHVTPTHPEFRTFLRVHNPPPPLQEHKKQMYAHLNVHENEFRFFIFTFCIFLVAVSILY